MTDQPFIFPVTMIERPFENPVKDPSGSGRSAVGIPLAALPDNFDLVNLAPYFDAHRESPAYRKGHAKLSPVSFVDYVNRFKHTDQTVLFVNKRLFWYTIKAVFDFHPPGSDKNKTGGSHFSAQTRVFGEDQLKSVIRAINLSVFLGSHEKK